MSSNIFTSCLNLKFLDKEIEIEYNIDNDKSIKKIHTFLLIVMIILSYTNSIYISIHISLWHDLLIIKSLTLSSYFATFVITFLAIIYLFNKDIIFIKWSNYIIYFTFFIIAMTGRFFMNRISNNLTTWLFFVILEFIIRILWTCTGTQSFIQVSVILLLNSIILWAVWMPMIPQNMLASIIFNAVFAMLLYLCIILTAYFYEKQRKTAFYYRKLSENKAIWLTGVLDNFDGGFLSMKSGKITFINKFLKKIFDRIYNLNSNLFNVEQERLNNLDNSEYELSINDKLQEFSLFIQYKNFSVLNIYEKFKQIISQITGIENFKLICDINLKFEEKLHYFQLHCRYSENNDELEFILNDYTLLIQTKEAEIKYKTIFLSKIAHELKNPLVSISEIVAQSFENLDPINNHDPLHQFFCENFSQIKSLSDYLLILIKDLNYFAEGEIKKDTIFLEKETDIVETKNFCEKITESLLKKSNKIESVNFKCIMEDNVPNIILTDEWKLKQILINLLSNAAKFTYYGSISLLISIFKSDINDLQIKFEIKDTGVGIPIEKQNNLFEPFGAINTLNNEMGSGLGLSISYDIAKKLGSGLNFSSVYKCGTNFWFMIPLKQINHPLLSQRIDNKTIDSSINLSNDSLSNCSTVKIDDLVFIKKYDNRHQHIIDRLYSENQFHDDDKSQANFLINLNSPDDSKFRSKTLQHTVSKTPKITLSLNEIHKPSNLKLIHLASITSVTDFVNNNNANILDKFRKINSNIEDYKINIIVADDENLTRKSSIRLLKNILKEKSSIVNIIQAKDGIETIFLFYKAITKGIQISYIFTDETMVIMDGIRSIEIVNEICEKKDVEVPSIYLVTAYSPDLLRSNVPKSIKKILTKPLITEDIKKCFIDTLK